MSPTVFVVTVSIAAALARTLVPFLQTLRDNPETKFDRQFLVPPIVSSVIAVITLPIALSSLPPELMSPASLNLSIGVAIFLAVWGATDITREIQKLLAVRPA